MAHGVLGSVKMTAACCCLIAAAVACGDPTASGAGIGGVPPPGETVMNEAIKDIGLVCDVKVLEKSIELTYELSNRSPRDIYALDLIPSIDLETKKAVLNYNLMHVNWRDSGALYVLKGIPAPPPHKRIGHYIIPQASKLEPNGVSKRTVSLPLPLREQNPYYLPLDVKEADEAKVDRIVFAMHVVRDTLEGFKVEGTELGPDIFYVRAKHLLVEREEIACRIDLKSMPVSKYKETFPRL